MQADLTSTGYYIHRQSGIEMDSTDSSQLSKETAVFGGGCFWCTEAVFSEVAGVEDVLCGYAGGTVPNPSYESVCSGTTGHAEVVKITYNPSKISYRELLQIFFSVHDPTTLDQQGVDYGSQYRSVILYNNEEQKRISEEVIGELKKDEVFGDPIVTEVVPLEHFYTAEEYHQHYFGRNPDKPYCRIVINPKLSKFRKHYRDAIKTT